MVNVRKTDYAAVGMCEVFKTAKRQNGKITFCKSVVATLANARGREREREMSGREKNKTRVPMVLFIKGAVLQSLSYIWMLNWTRTTE